MNIHVLIDIMIYLGSALMVYNIVRYFRFMKDVRSAGGWEKGACVLYIPAVLLILFLLGYLTVGLIGHPDTVVAGILLGGSIFVFLILYVMRVITERVRQNEHLKTELEDEKRANEAKSIFLSNMSHDIRTPMNAIIGYTTLGLRPGVTNEELKDYLKKIDSSGHHLLALINDILEMSRIENGKMELEEEPVDLQQVMDDLRTMFATQMKEKPLTWQVACDIENNYVSCDKNRLNRVLLNLVSNAYKFTPEEGAVSVTLRQTGKNSPDEGIYEFRVKDTGIGMAPEFAEKVFDAFERERTSTVSGIQGTGLGMAITKNIVDLLGGTITVDTEPNKGTEFTVKLNFRIIDKPVVHTEEKPDCPMTKEEREKAGFRMLLAEDMEVNREIAAMLLAEEGILVDFAENGQIAVEKVRAAAPGYYKAVLMDEQMPVMDGYEATRQIRALEDPASASIPIIAVTANAFREDVQRALDAGMDGHVSKPIDPDALMQTLYQIVCGGNHS
ncbi:MAG: response regulator [Lachnospiraceae bacterium]|nr:response regulator [Lachnospiraceae bacterium]